MPADTPTDIAELNRTMSALARLVADARARVKRHGADAEFCAMVKRGREMERLLRTSVRNNPKLATATRGYLDMADTQLMALERTVAATPRDRA